MTDTIQLYRSDGVFQIRINRPEKKNALTRDMYSQMTQALQDAETDTESRVIFITGIADSFSSGNDLADFLESSEEWETSQAAQFLKVIAQAKKPIVAAVNGVAVGVGTTMLLHCDLVYACGKARFQLPFVQLGLVPEAASSFLLPHLVGYHKAAELLLLGEMFDADQAQSMGLVNAIFSDEHLEKAALEKALNLAQQPPNALQCTKALMKRNITPYILEAMTAEGKHFFDMLQSAEAKAAMQAFFNRKKQK